VRAFVEAPPVDVVATTSNSNFPMELSLADSYEHCRQLARRTGKNFYYSFLVLPGEMRRDMCVLYAFMRVTDDLGDDPGTPCEERSRRLEEWRAALDHGLRGTGGPEFATRREPAPRETSPPDPAATVLPALRDMVRRRGIPPRYLRDVIDGVATDLSPRTIESFADLERYCYQVAGAVGLCCIHVWGFRDESALPLAVDCGTAFQLTNILRDLREDAAAGRVYLPREDLERHQYSLNDIRNCVRDGRFRELMQFEAQRARGFYSRGARLLDQLERPGRAILTAMLRIYGGLLDEIERRDFDIYSSRVELSQLCKSWIALTSLIRPGR
jgi:phytoene synthase